MKTTVFAIYLFFSCMEIRYRVLLGHGSQILQYSMNNFKCRWFFFFAQSIQILAQYKLFIFIDLF